MSAKKTVVLERVLDEAGWVHHWVIESPGGPESRGVCRRCGVQKGFANSTIEAVWEDERKSANESWAA